MSLVHSDKMHTLLGRYAAGDASALVDPGLVAIAQDYRRAARSRMKPIDADAIKKLPGTLYHCSLKIDGEFNCLVYQDGEAILVNPGGTVRTGLPILDRLAQSLAVQFLLQKQHSDTAARVRRAVLAGELYYDVDGDRARVHDVSRFARRPSSQQELDHLCFAAFDIIEWDGEQFATFAEKWLEIITLPCPVYAWCKNADDIKKHFDRWVMLEGAEGIVLRSDQAGSFKVKQRHTIDAAVIGYTENENGIHDLLVALMRADGTFQILGRVGGGFTDQDRRDWLADLKDDVVVSDYVEANEGLAYQWVRPVHVIEISILDLITQTTRGAPINAMCLDWDDKLQGGTIWRRWWIVRKLPLATMISPQFIRRREDKTVNAQDLRLEQVTDLVEVELADVDARQFELPKSTVLKRQAWTKQLKGGTGVRKLVMWATNKGGNGESGVGSRDFPAFVLHFTDYSPGRAEPLQRDIRVSNSREQIDKLWDELVKENVVKGWAAVA